jgi:hypothetical protein
MSLNPEPAAPEERAQLDLAPRSYTDAAKEALEPASHVHGTDGTVEDAKLRLRSKIDSVKANGVHIPSVDDNDTLQHLRSRANASNTNGNTTPPRLDGADSLEGVGLDASPKSPTAKGHRRKGSRNLAASGSHKHGEPMGTELYEKHLNGHGDTLISLKPQPELEKDRRIDVALKDRNRELKSGRQAGAGWGRSKYVKMAAGSINQY